MKIFKFNNMYRKLLAILFAAIFAFPAFAQENKGGVEGTVVNRNGRVPVPDAAITLYRGETVVQQSQAGSDGYFSFGNLPDGIYRMTVESPGFERSVVNVTVEGFMKDLMFVSLVPTEALAIDIDDSNFAEFDMIDSGYDDAPSIIYGNDVYSNIAGYGFSQIRFRQRGYDSRTQDVYLSGVRLNDALTGYTPWSLWSGLNEATRNKEVENGLDMSGYGVGGYNGVTNIFATPSTMRKGYRFSVLTNSAFYRLRLMGSYATGEMDNGWSFAVNVSARIGGNDWVEGMYYRAFAYYLGAEKNWYDTHRLSLAIFGSPVQRGAQNGSTQEVYDLVGSNYYNSNWGYQNGKVRNARVRNNHEPVAVLKYSWTPDDRLGLDVTAIYRTGRNGYSALDWYDAPDPRPDYYRNLPSYFYNPESNMSNRDDPYLAGWAEEAWIYNYNNTQHINWDRLYNVNRNNIDAEYDPELKRSKYIQEERRTDQNDLNLNAQVKYRFDRWFTLKGGVNYRLNRTQYYKIVKDLLGGDYYVNIDQFAERDFAMDEQKIQNDLQYYLINGHAEMLQKGDRYGYDYTANVHDARLWADLDFEHGNWKAYLAAQGGYNTFWRFGNVQKGLFPDNSYGKSDVAGFFTWRAKAGATYINGPHRVWANVGYYNDAPYFASSFVSPRTRNSLTPNLTTEKTFSADLSYAFNKNGYSVRVTGFYSNISDQTDLMSFYDDSQNSFTNFAMTGIGQRHAGVELGFKVPVPVQGLSVVGALNWGDYIYTTTPHVIQTVDNNGEIVMDATVPYWKAHNIYQKDAAGNYVTDASGEYVVSKVQKHYVPSTPQIAASLGLDYSFNYLFAGIELQYFDKMYLDMNPLYRTNMAVMGPDVRWTPEEEEYMAAQERFPHAFVLSANIGKSWYIQRKYNIGFSLEVRNILNNRSVKTGGYEQTRLIDSEDFTRYYRFDSRYFYMVGVNYMLNIYFRF